MKRQSGFFRIKLAKPIKPSGFAYEHVLSGSILDDNQLSCSPKMFNVFGYQAEDTGAPISLSQFEYKIPF